MRHMKFTPRQNAFVVAALAVFFWWAFHFAKHDPKLRGIIPFGEDPYDAVSSFGAIAALLLALVCFLRLYFPLWVGHSEHPMYVLRTQAAIPFCVLVTVAAELVAMLRHTSTWVGKAGSARLLILQTALAGLALGALASIKRGKSETRDVLIGTGFAWLTALVALALYPEQVILGTPGHLLTVLLGAVFLFALVSVSVKAWAPGNQLVDPQPRKRKRGAPGFGAFTVAVAIGSAIGALAYLSEVVEDTAQPRFAQIFFVGGIFVSLGAAGIAIGYAFLGEVLDLKLR